MNNGHRHRHGDMIEQAREVVFHVIPLNVDKTTPCYMQYSMQCIISFSIKLDHIVCVLNIVDLWFWVKNM